MAQRAHLKWPPRTKAPLSEGGSGRKVTTTQLKPGGKAMRRKFGDALCRTHGARCPAVQAKGRKALRLTSRGLSCLGV